jgi:hypothetical protein
MKRLITLICVLGLVSVSNAQTAKVIALSPEDAKQVKSLQDQEAVLQQKILALHAQIRDRYVKTAWYGDFLYSEDFKYIVPMTTSNNFTVGCCNYSAMCLNTITPWTFTAVVTP